MCESLFLEDKGKMKIRENQKENKKVPEFIKKITNVMIVIFIEFFKATRKLDEVTF